MTHSATTAPRPGWVAWQENLAQPGLPGAMAGPVGFGGMKFRGFETLRGASGMREDLVLTLTDVAWAAEFWTSVS